MDKYEKLRQRFYALTNEKWFCVNTYDRNFKEATNKSGVYYIAEISRNDLSNTNKIPEIVYIGSSTNLMARYNRHEKIDFIRKNNKMPIFYFLEMNSGFYDLELKMIRKLRPKYNKMLYTGGKK